MEQMYRDEFAHYFNTTPSDTNPTWKLEGIGVDSMPLAFNPQVDQYKTIIDRNASASFKNYQLQASISGKRIYKDDPIYTWLKEFRRLGKSIETEMLEVDMAETVTSSTSTAYKATKCNVLIVFTDFLGEDAVISYDIYIQGDLIDGTVTIANKVPTFVENV